MLILKSVSRLTVRPTTKCVTLNMSRIAMAVDIRALMRHPLHAPQFPSKSAVRLPSSTRRLSAQMFPKSPALPVLGRCVVMSLNRTVSSFQLPPTARTFRRSSAVNVLISTRSQSHVRSVDLALQSLLEERKERGRRDESEEDKSAILIISKVDIYCVVF